MNLNKKSDTFKILIPAKVEEKIRYLCRKFPTLEWSGVLFTSYTGSFEDNNLQITCEDIFPMDLGTSTFTSYNMDPSVAAYIAQNPELFECDIQLIHSHNRMQAFFSGTDLQTLKTEGMERNCFVSLIVNNEGTYCAAVTRKVHLKKQVTTQYKEASYEFFGEGTKTTQIPNDVEDVDTTVVEYFMLDIETQKVDNPLAYLDERFEEINKNKTEQWADTPQKTSYIDMGKTERELPLFHDYTPTIVKQVEDDTTVDKKLIHTFVGQMLTCSFIISDKADIKQWVIKYMDKKYKNIFQTEEQFDSWKQFIIAFLIEGYYNSVSDSEVISNEDIIDAMIEDLQKYPTNYYIQSYCETLESFKW